MTVLTCLDLFSCIGCHAIGMEAAGWATAGFVEINEWRRARLAERFPGVPIHDDVRTYTGRRGGAFAVIGGPPCQATSVAAAIHGYRSGDSLWPEMLRVCNDVVPEWVVVEQPPGNAAWEAEVAADLQRSGYHSARVEFEARDVGAPYLRRRVYVLACPSLSRLAVAREALPRAIDEVARAANARGAWDPDQLASLPVDARTAGEHDGGPRSAERKQWIEALGDSNPPAMMEAIGRALALAST